MNSVTFALEVAPTGCSRAGREGATAKALLLVSLTKQVESSEEEAQVSMPTPKAHV